MDQDVKDFHSFAKKNIYTFFLKDDSIRYVLMNLALVYENIRPCFLYDINKSEKRAQALLEYIKRNFINDFQILEIKNGTLMCNKKAEIEQINSEFIKLPGIFDLTLGNLLGFECPGEMGSPFSHIGIHINVNWLKTKKMLIDFSCTCDEEIPNPTIIEKFNDIIAKSKKIEKFFTNAYGMRNFKISLEIEINIPSKKLVDSWIKNNKKVPRLSERCLEFLRDKSAKNQITLNEIHN